LTQTNPKKVLIEKKRTSYIIDCFISWFLIISIYKAYAAKHYKHFQLFFSFFFSIFEGMTKRLKNSLKFLTETETNKKLKLKNFFQSFSWYWKVWKKLKKSCIFRVLCLKKLKNVNKTLKTENFYWWLYFTENRFRIDVKNTEKWEQELKMRMNLKNKWLGPKIKKKFILPFLVIWPWPRGIWPWPDPIRGFCPRATFLLFKKSFLLFESLFFHFLQDYILPR